MNDFTKFTLKYFFGFFLTVLTFKKVAVSLMNSSNDLYAIFGVSITVCLLILWINIIRKDFFKKPTTPVENSNKTNEEKIDGESQSTKVSE